MLTLAIAVTADQAVETHLFGDFGEMLSAPTPATGFRNVAMARSLAAGDVVLARISHTGRSLCGQCERCGLRWLLWYRTKSQEGIVKVAFLFTGSGPLVIVTSHESLQDPALLEKLSAKGITKFIAYEVPIEIAEQRYGGTTTSSCATCTNRTI